MLLVPYAIHCLVVFNSKENKNTEKNEKSPRVECLMPVKNKKPFAANEKNIIRYFVSVMCAKANVRSHSPNPERIFKFCRNRKKCSHSTGPSECATLFAMKIWIFYEATALIYYWTNHFDGGNCWIERRLPCSRANTACSLCVRVCECV